MRKLIMIAALAFPLTGCATTGGTLPDAATLASQIRAYTQQACGFLPLVTDTVVSALVASYFPAGAPLQQAVATIGAAICAGTSPPTAVLRAGATVTKIVQTPRGPVKVQGRFVR